MSLDQKTQKSSLLASVGKVITGFVAGLGAYQTSLHLTDRTLVSSTELAALRESGAHRVLVDGPTIEIRKGVCEGNALQVTETFKLRGTGKPARFVVLNMGEDEYGFTKSNKPGDDSMKATDGGWTFSYCADAGWRSTYYRRFVNLDTGMASELVQVKVGAQQ